MEVIEHRGRRHSCGRGDVGDCDGLISTGGEQGPCGIEYCLSAAGELRAAPAGIGLGGFNFGRSREALEIYAGDLGETLKLATPEFAHPGKGLRQLARVDAEMRCDIALLQANGLDRGARSEMGMCGNDTSKRIV